MDVKYFVYVNGKWLLYEAIDMEDLILLMASGNKEINFNTFKKAIVGCKSVKDYVEMYNAFVNSYFKVSCIYELGRQLF